MEVLKTIGVGFFVIWVIIAVLAVLTELDNLLVFFMMAVICYGLGSLVVSIVN